MRIDAIKQPIEIANVAEAARQIGACRNTLARAIDRAGLLPDAISIEAGRRVPCFVVSRLPQLADLLKK